MCDLAELKDVPSLHFLCSLFVASSILLFFFFPRFHLCLRGCCPIILLKNHIDPTYVSSSRFLFFFYWRKTKSTQNPRSFGCYCYLCCLSFFVLPLDNQACFFFFQLLLLALASERVTSHSAVTGTTVGVSDGALLYVCVCVGFFFFWLLLCHSFCDRAHGPACWHSVTCCFAFFHHFIILKRTSHALTQTAFCVFVYSKANK